MDDHSNFEIKQLIAAQPGFRAVYREDDGAFNVSDDVVVAWALADLVVTKGKQEVERHSGNVVGCIETSGLEGIEVAESISGFRGYARPGESDELAVKRIREAQPGA